MKNDLKTSVVILGFWLGIGLALSAGSNPALAAEKLAGGSSPALAAEKLAGSPNPSVAAGKLAAAPNLSEASEKNAMELARRTWRYFEACVDPKTGIPADSATWDGKLPDLADYTSITNVGVYLMAIPAAVDLGFITPADAEKRLTQVVTVLEALPKSKGGLFYNYFGIKEGNKVDSKLYVSSVDDAWLAAGLRVAAHDAPEPMKARLLKLYQQIDFSHFYNPDLGQMRLGYSDLDHKVSPYNYGLIATEARIVSVIAIANGQAPASCWFRIFRTLPAAWNWQKQKPVEKWKQVGRDKFPSGYYLVDGVKLVPSWGGSLFEFLMPLLVVPELEYATQGLGENDRRAVKLQENYCLKTKKYPVWGLSPCATISDKKSFTYTEEGYAAMGAKGYGDTGWVTPYASLLALEVDPAGVEANIHVLQTEFPACYTPYGFLDAVNVSTHEAVKRFLTLDQGMIFISLHNYLKQGATRKRFFTGDMEKKIRPLLEHEAFY